ncbi:hypothetical protein [Lentibacillus amyloliquefaciens]|uniref:Uncharacterized protein n=1 Tax=Lentibacillus amyloliquefaciens TaxID=1472767 RepID=A0A0U3WKF3_9BACI|nr:hypothetical protein [Lentibacillus amyloliquefaciens]ALX50319.1 hypothetical protein AOX59_18085 [Lentibacillus amyloliquefaciens]
MNEIMWVDFIFQLIFLIILAAIVALIVLAIRALSKRSKQMDTFVTNIIITIVILLALWFALDFIGVNASYLVPKLIEWATKFIFPWVVLYWFIRLTKSLEKR